MIQLLYLRNYPSFGVFDEFDEVLDFGAVGNLFFYLVDSIEDARLSMEHKSVGIGDVFLHFITDALDSEHSGVDTTIFHRTAMGDDIGRHIFGEGGASLDHGAIANTCAGILDDARREDDTIADLAVTGDFRSISEDTMVAHHGIV